jgi:hypothetical protein
METLCISPNYTSEDWAQLDETKAEDWPKAVAILRDRLHGRFIHFADKCLKDEYSGFVVLSIDCLLAETIQQFIEGKQHSKNESGMLFRRFLERPHFQPYFTETVRSDFYADIRCGLLHQAEAKNRWLVRSNQAELLKTVGADGYIIDVKQFHSAVKKTFKEYLTLLTQPENVDLRAKLWTKMNYICNTRTARGVLYGADPSAASPTA